MNAGGKWLIGTVRGDSHVTRWVVTWDGQVVRCGGRNEPLGLASDMHSAVGVMRSCLNREVDDLALTGLASQFTGSKT